MPQGLKREKWSSWLAFVWVATGAAVGLGNVWKFPYMAGTFGGSAFVLLYLFFVLLVGVPVMAAEIMLGKISQRNAVDGLIYLADKSRLSKNWRLLGYLGSLSLQLIFCFYSVIAGFSVAYLYFGASNKFAQKTPAEIENIWLQFLAEPRALILCSFLFILATMAIVYCGVNKGIERACTYMMPGLLLVLMLLVGYSAVQGGFFEAWNFLFAFEPQKIEASVVIAALGHAFFTLAVGACALMVYGSYLPKESSVFKSVIVVALLDVLVALLSGLAIFPLIFKNGLSPSQGPGLMFLSLPIVFAHMPFGWFWGTLFFVLLFFAALSSSLSFAEPLVNLFIEKFRFKRHHAAFLIGAVTALGSVFCSLSFNLLSHVKVWGLGIFDLVADLSTNLLLPIGGIGIAVFAGLVIKKADLFSGKGDVLFYLWKFIILLVAPISILIVLINSFM